MTDGFAYECKECGNVVHAEKSDNPYRKIIEWIDWNRIDVDTSGVSGDACPGCDEPLPDAAEYWESMRRSEHAQQQQSGHYN